MNVFHCDNRSLQILNILEENFLIKEKNLKDVLRVSSKTIQNEVKELNKTFEGTAFIKNENSEYMLYIIKLEKYLKIKSNLYEQFINFDSSKIRMSYIFKKLLEKGDYYLMDDLADEMTVSRSTLNKDLKKLKQTIAEYDLQIKGKTNSGIKIVGKEKDIRFFIIENIYNYIYKENIFDKHDIQKIDSSLETHELDKHVKNKFLKFLTVSVDRYANEFYLNFSEEEYKELLTYYPKDFINDICSHIKERYYIDLTEAEKKFLTICFATMRLPINIDNLIKNVQYTYEYKKIVNEIFISIYNKYGINIEVDNIKEEFIYHVYFLIQRLKYGVKYKNNMKEIIKEKYMMSYKVAKTASKVIEDKYGFIVSEDEVCYLAIYFETFLANIIEKAELKILIITEVGPAYKELMKQQLKGDLRGDIEIEFTNTENDINKTHDLVISTIEKELHIETPVIYQKEILDIEYIKKQVDFLRYMDNINLPFIRGMESILLSSINEETFFVCDPKKTYTENLEYMITELNRKGIVDEGFLARIQARKSTSMIFNNNIAFPHTSNDACNRIVISMGVSKDGFKDDENIKIIFLAALPKEQENTGMLVKAYDELISIIREEKIIEDISSIRDYKNLVDYFIKNTNLYR